MAGDDDNPSINPFNDSDWLPFGQIHRLLWQQRFGVPDVSALELTEALATRVPSMKRSPTHFTDREIVPFEFWNDHDLYWLDSCLAVIPTHPLAGLNILEGFVGYAWLPKLAEVWPTIFAPMLQGPPPQPQKPPQEPQPEAPKPPTKAKTWVPYAMKQWPQEKDENPSDYVDRLRRHTPKSWTRKTIQNLLSAEKKQEKKQRR